MKQFLTPYRATIKSFRKTCLWMAGNACCGLAPFIVVGVFYAIGLNPHAAEIAKDEFLHLINDGALAFFFPGLVGSIAVDVFLARKKFRDKMASVIILIAFAVFIIMAVVVIYLVLIYSGTKGQGFRDIPRVQGAIIAISIIFIILAKTSLFIEEEKEERL